MVVEAWYGILSAVFSPVFALPIPIAVMVLAIFVLTIITLFNKFLIDQRVMKELKEEQKSVQAKAKELQKTNPEEAKKMYDGMMKLANKQMKMNMKAMIPTFIVVFAFLPWMGTVFPGIVVNLPFSLPYFEADFGWLMWYVIISIPVVTLLRKGMGVN